VPEEDLKRVGLGLATLDQRDDGLAPAKPPIGFGYWDEARVIYGRNPVFRRTSGDDLLERDHMP
jgi:hypothetical protein